jgi:OFA family oxalate/formate antiporter-like MFS transporter
VLTKHIMANTGIDDKSIVTWAFSIAIFFLGMSAAFLGNYVEKIGPRKSAFLCCLFFGVGLIGSGIASVLQNLPLLFFFYGVVGGIGLGIGYITPVKTLIRWFYDKKGFATGIAVMGFGFAAMIAGPLMEALISSIGLAKMFFVLGACYMTLIFTASRLIAPPPDDYEKESKQTATSSPLEQYTTSQAVRKLSFYALWFMLFVNISSGISLLAIASPMLQEKFPLIMTAAVSAAVVGIISLCNGLGRFVWSSLSDFLGRPIVYSGFFLLQTGLFLGLAFTTNHLVFQVLLFLIASCYGGGFACIPAYLSDMFGVKQVSAIHGRVLTAWACAGVVGPFFTTWVNETTGGYTSILIYISIALATAFAVSTVAAREYKKRHGSLVKRAG